MDEFRAYSLARNAAEARARIHLVVQGLSEKYNFSSRMGKKNKQGVGRSIIKDRSKAGKGQHGTDGWVSREEKNLGRFWAEHVH